MIIATAHFFQGYVLRGFRIAELECEVGRLRREWDKASQELSNRHPHEKVTWELLSHVAGVKWHGFRPYQTIRDLMLAGF